MRFWKIQIYNLIFISLPMGMAEKEENNSELGKYRILKIGKKYMVQKKGMRITPTSYGNLVPARANEFKMPVDLDTAKARIELCKGNGKVVYED